jgi:SAM-dependent methyltransferase
MRLGHRKVPANILEGRRVLDIGCGRNKHPGSVGLDHMPLPGVDVVASLEQVLPFNDGEFDAVFANQVLEHVRDMVGLMAEIHRILRPGGILLAHVPYFRSSWAHIDPTHVRGSTINSLDFFVAGTYCHEGYRFGDYDFTSREVYLDQDYPSTLLRHVLTPLAIAKPFRYENSILSMMYPFEQISYVLTK